MLLVELIYDPACPNVSQARDNLLRAFALIGVNPQFTEWNRNESQTPSYARRYGSPSILVNGKDIAGVSDQYATNHCRVYLDSDECNKGAPSVALIAKALSESVVSN